MVYLVNTPQKLDKIKNKIKINKIKLDQAICLAYFRIKSEIQPFCLKIAVNAIFQFTVVQAASFPIKIKLPWNRWYIARILQMW